MAVGAIFSKLGGTLLGFFQFVGPLGSGVAAQSDTAIGVAESTNTDFVPLRCAVAAQQQVIASPSGSPVVIASGDTVTYSGNMTVTGDLQVTGDLWFTFP